MIKKSLRIIIFSLVVIQCLSSDDKTNDKVQLKIDTSNQKPVTATLPKSQINIPPKIKVQETNNKKEPAVVQLIPASQEHLASTGQQTVKSHTQSSKSHQISSPVQQQQQVIEQALQQIHQQQLQQQLPSWIAQQLHQFNSLIQLPITQTFSFILQPSFQTQFKWNPSKNKALKLIVNIFQLNQQGDLKVIKDGQDYQYVQVFIRNPLKRTFVQVGKVYRVKVFTINFDTDFKYIKFINRNVDNVLIQIDVQMLEYVIETAGTGLKDHKLSPSSNKMLSILKETQAVEIQREHLYKWQWGYLANEKIHQKIMLGLTGIQLFAIIITAVIQMYFLKTLLDNRAVV